MQIEYLKICRFKSIICLEIEDISQALILVGQNSTGKTTVLDAIRAVGGDYRIVPEDFDESGANIEITVRLSLCEEDLKRLQKRGRVSSYRRWDSFLADVKKKLPSFDGETLTFTYIVNRDGRQRFDDGFKKNNPYIRDVFPTIYYIDAERNPEQFQNDMLYLQEDAELKSIRENRCLFNGAKACTHCFSCIGLINQKKPEELTALETFRLLNYKLYQRNLNTFAGKVNEAYAANGGQDTIFFSMSHNTDAMLTVTTEFSSGQEGTRRPIERLGKGMRSIYMLSVLEAYAEDENAEDCILMMEDPEIFLHPSMQKTTGDILYRLSKKHQVIFSTHSPNLLPNFSIRQIRQMVLDKDDMPTVRKDTDISAILNDLGYTAGDLMNVDFVFIVEGRQDKTRLPILLKKYYSEIYDKDGRLSRTAIITTNSCTNIKTYANLKYMNQVYIKDHFLMIRDGDGKNAEDLRRGLCKYYEEQNARDVDRLPRVKPENVLVLKYYSFENYFLNPEIMCRIGVLKSPEQFYKIFLSKWKEYLYKLKSGRHLTAVIGRDFNTTEDVKAHMEEIKIYMRGHNLFDIFYGRYRKEENELLTRYVELADREEFADILQAIDHFMYFESRKKE